LIPQSTKFLDTQGILSVADSIRCATVQIKGNNQHKKYSPSSSEGRYNHVKGNKQKGDKEGFEVGVFVQVKGGGSKPNGKISDEKGKQQLLVVQLVGLDRKLEQVNAGEKTSRMMHIQQERELPTNIKVLFGLAVADDGSIELEVV
jgi:hypothetical protein